MWLKIDYENTQGEIETYVVSIEFWEIDLGDNLLYFTPTGDKKQWKQWRLAFARNIYIDDKRIATNRFSKPVQDDTI